MMVFKRKQVVILSLVLMIIVAGYLNYSYKKGSISVSGKDSGKLGEAVYVDNLDGKDVAAQGQEDAKAPKAQEQKDTKAPKTSSVSKQANDIFAQAKLEKEVARGKSEDSLKLITEDVNAGKETKAKAYEQMMGLVAQSEKEAKIETLLKEKGFGDAVAILGEDGSADVMVKAPKLTQAQVAQISDIVSTQAKVQMTDIRIKNIY